MGWRGVRPGALAAFLLVVGLTGACAGLEVEPGPRQDRKDTATSAAGERPGSGKPGKPGAGSGERQGRPETRLVVRVVDGDTVVLGNGRYVRLLGMDAPEAGECGSERATANLARLVEGRRVELARGPVDEDRYDRLLRYLDLGTLDAGLRLVKNGLAIARYDSRDGYGAHPREARYIAADRASPDVGCAPVAKPQPFAGSSGGCGGYSPCLPAYPPDLDCPDVDGPIRVSGADPHGLDADGDGVACEWG